LFTNADKTTFVSVRWRNYPPEEVNKWAKKTSKFNFVFLGKVIQPVEVHFESKSLR